MTWRVTWRSSQGCDAIPCCLSVHSFVCSSIHCPLSDLACWVWGFAGWAWLVGPGWLGLRPGWLGLKSGWLGPSPGWLGQRFYRTLTRCPKSGKECLMVRKLVTEKENGTEIIEWRLVFCVPILRLLPMSSLDEYSLHLTDNRDRKWLRDRARDPVGTEKDGNRTKQGQIYSNLVLVRFDKDRNSNPIKLNWYKFILKLTRNWRLPSGLY